MLFQMYEYLFFEEVILRHSVQSKPFSIAYAYRNAITQIKKGATILLGIMKHLSKYSPTTYKICELLRRLASAISECTWNKAYQDVYNKAKALIKEDAYMSLTTKREPNT